MVHPRVRHGTSLVPCTLHPLPWRGKETPSVASSSSPQPWWHRKKSSCDNLRITKTVSDEARNVVLVVFYENGNLDRGKPSPDHKQTFPAADTLHVFPRSCSKLRYWRESPPANNAEQSKRAMQKRPRTPEREHQFVHWVDPSRPLLSRDTKTSRISVLNALTNRRVLFDSYEIIYSLLIPHQESYLGNQHSEPATDCKNLSA